ncbi:MAG: ion transporter [Lachnospiraceae bacterium]|nr:ion transporter [Lachnospiraceae bacterium]
MKKKRIIQIILSIIGFYFFLTILLFIVETIPKGGEQSITSIGDAAWYLLATLTTVGYGDVTPVTLAGKVIGAVMMISSAGVLTFLLGLMFTILFGALLPSLRLWCVRNRDWYVFSTLDERTQLLAERLAKEDAKAAFVFCGNEDTVSQEHYPTMHHHVIIDEPLEVVVKRQNPAKLSHIFFMTEDGWENYHLGRTLLDRADREGLKVYCEADHAPDKYPADMVLFHRPDTIARSYWTTYPVEQGEKTILIIGDGKVARHLLERGILINVLSWEHPLEYHLFGDWEAFRRDHYELGKIVGIGQQPEGEDGVYFETQEWNASPEVLANAGRILFCDDDEEVNLYRMAELRKFFPTKAQVDVYASHEDDRCRSFGGDDRLLTREMVMQEKLNKLAILLNDLYRSKTGSGCEWTELSEFHRQSNIAAADHLLTKVRILLPKENVTTITPEICMRAFANYSARTGEQKEACRWLEHKRWVRFHVMNNWSNAEVRDNALRHHTMIVPYDQLSKAEQALDDSAWEVLGEIK